MIAVLYFHLLSSNTHTHSQNGAIYSISFQTTVNPTVIFVLCSICCFTDLRNGKPLPFGPDVSLQMILVSLTGSLALAKAVERPSHNSPNNFLSPCIDSHLDTEVRKGGNKNTVLRQTYQPRVLVGNLKLRLCIVFRYPPKLSQEPLKKLTQKWHK